MNVADDGDDQIQTERGQQVIQAQNVDVWEAMGCPKADHHRMDQYVHAHRPEEHGGAPHCL